jgi:hypothetical protein
MTFGRKALASLLIALGAWAALGAAPSVASAAGCTSGQLIKGSGAAVYYCGGDARRYVFPNLGTFRTWYQDFSTVQKLSDAAIADIQIGGNVTYKPGARLVKITSSPRVYAVDAGGVLRAIGSEAVAAQLYGSAWSKMVDDISDAFFSNYSVGSDITSSGQFSPTTAAAGATSINTDKRLAATPVSTVTQGVSLTLSPDISTITSAQTMTVTVSATDPDGIAGVSLFLKGEVLKSCSQNSSTTSATCSTTINGGDYADGTVLSLYGQEVSRYGTRHVTATKGVTASGGTAVASSVTLAYSPASTTLNAGQSTTVTVTAFDPAGLSSVSVFVNGAVAQNCAQNGVVTTATCTTMLYGSNYPSGSTVVAYGQAANKNGKPTISASTTFNVEVGASASGGSVGLSFSPSGTQLKIGESVVVEISAYAPHGVTGMALYANGSRVQSCSASGSHSRASCSVTLYGNNYASGSTVAVYGQATDTDGIVVVSPTTNLTILAGANNSNAVSLSFSPYATSLATSQSTTVTVSATDSYAVSSIEVYVNGTLTRTCTMTSSSLTGSCAVTINGANYASGSTIAIYGREHNTNGGTNTSATSTLSVTSAAVGGGSVSLFVAPSVTTLTGTQTATVTVNAYDPSGLSAVNVFINGANVRSCSQSGTWPTGASCTYVVAAGNYNSGTKLNIYGQGVSTSTTTTNSAVTSLTIN